MSPGLSVGIRNCSTQARKFLALIGPSKTQGAVISSQRKAAINVIVFRWPYGAFAASLWPRRHQPRNGAMFVLAQVSSTNTSRDEQMRP
jgi:hypothetical protein